MRLALGHRPVVLTGPNGAGKTNILEALSLLSPGRGLRRAARRDFPRQGMVSPLGQEASVTTPWSIYAKLETDAGPLEVGTGIQPDKLEGARAVRLNGVKSNLGQLASYFAVSWLTPQMDGLFIGSPSSRRRFVDRLAIAFDPAHSGRLSRYEKLYRERQRLIQEGGNDDSWLLALETQLAETGMAIMAARAALTRAVSEAAYQSDAHLGFPRLHMAMTGGGCAWLDEMPALAAEDKMKETARARRQAGDLSMPGPQAQDLTTIHLDKGQQAQLASTGEQKALMIAAILAHARLQAGRLDRPPLLLLDDVAAHLDEEKRHCLFAATSELKGQVWYSGTDRVAFSAMNQFAQFFNVSQGQIEPQ